MKTLMFLWSAVLSSFVFFQTADAFAQKIYLLAFCDPTDVYQSQAFVNDVERMKTAFMFFGNQNAVLYNQSSFAPESDKWTGEQLYPYDPFNYDGSSYDSRTSAPANDTARRYANSDHDVFRVALNALRRCPAGSDDALVVYWSGHGFFDNNEHFLAQKNGAGQCSRDVLLTEAKKVGARLTVLLTDACANEIAEVKTYNGTYAPTARNPRLTPLFKELFFNYRGVLNVNSSVRGQASFSYPLKTGVGGSFRDESAGCFSLALTSDQAGKYPFYSEITREPYLRKAMRGESFEAYMGFGAFDVFVNQTPSWEEVLQYVQSTTNFVYRRTSVGKNGGSTQPNQTIWIVEKPVKSSNRPQTSSVTDTNFDNHEWSKEAVYRPEKGDRVVAVNGQEVRNAEDFRAKVANSPSVIVLTVVDHRSGDVYYARTTLKPRSYSSRLGLLNETDLNGGVRITGYVRGYPINRCQYASE